jgi:NADH-quinone oxidoreductase subunit L
MMVVMAVHDAHGHDNHHAAHDSHGHDAHHVDPAGEDSGHEPDTHAPGADAVPQGTGGYHPHAAPWTMLLPLVLLSVGAVFAGVVFHGWFIEPTAGEEYWKGSVAFNEHLMHAMHGVPLWVKLAPAVVMLTGFGIAYAAYMRDTTIPARFTGTFVGLYDFLLHKWYFDELYNLIFVRPAFALGRFLWKRGDVATIDRFGPDGISALVVGGGALTRRFQSGYVYTYAFVMLLGLVGAATWAMAH